jgi:hypothetical protein
MRPIFATPSRLPIHKPLPGTAALLLAIVSLLLGPAPTSAQPGPAPYPADALVFLSGNTIDRILSAADDTEYQLPGSDNARLRVIRLRTAFDQQPGLLRASLQVSLPGLQGLLSIEAGVRLLPEHNATNGRLLLRPQITELGPELSGDLLNDTLRAVAVGTVKSGLDSITETMPGLDFDLQREIRLAQPQSSHPVEFRLGKAWVEGQLQAPAMVMDMHVVTRDLLYSRRGLFALIDIGSGPATTRPTVTTTPDPAILDTLVPPNEHTFLHLRGTTLQRLANDLNRLPPQARTLNLYSSDTGGKLFSRGRLGLGCGSDGRLINPGAVAGRFVLGPIRSHWADGRLDLQLPLWIQMGARARVRVKGFPAPCGLTSPRPRCRCARGKTSFAANTLINEGIGLYAAIDFVPGLEAGVDYRVLLTAPESLSLSPRVSIGRLGSLRIPVDIPVPIGEVARGPLPLALEQRGRLLLGIPPTVSKAYELRLSNTRLEADQNGLGLGFSLDLEFHQR